MSLFTPRATHSTARFGSHWSYVNSGAMLPTDLAPNPPAATLATFAKQKCVLRTSICAKIHIFRLSMENVFTMFFFLLSFSEFFHQKNKIFKYTAARVVLYFDGLHFYSIFSEMANVILQLVIKNILMRNLGLMLRIHSNEIH